MSRPVDWTPLRESDPVPGAPDAVEVAAHRFDALAQKMRHQAALLRRMATAEGLSGHYVDTIRAGADDLAGRLDDSAGRYTETGSALREYVPVLTDGQHRSLTALADGQDAEARRAAEQAAADAVRVPTAFDPITMPETGWPGASPDQTSAALAEKAEHQQAADAAAQQVAQARHDLDAVAAEVDHAARAAATRIRAAVDDAVADSWWDDVKDWIHEHRDTLSTVATWAGYIGMAVAVIALAVPGLNILVAIGIGAGVLALGAHSALALSGDGSWADVGLDAVSLATLGAGKYLSGGVKLGGRVFGGGLETAYAELKAAERARVLARAGAEQAAGAAHAYEAALVRLNRPTATATTALERLVLGAGDSRVADILIDSRRTIERLPGLFPHANAVEFAAAKARSLYGASLGAGAVGAFSDGLGDWLGIGLPGWSQFKDRTVWEWGSTW